MSKDPDKQQDEVVEHLSPCKRMKGIYLQYSYKNYSDLFVCITCGKTRRFSLNFLGGRRVPMCNGKTITASEKLSFEAYKALQKQIEDAGEIKSRQEH